MAEFIRDAAGTTEAQQQQADAYLFAQLFTGLAIDGVLAGLGVTQTGTASASVLIAAGGGVVQDTVSSGAKRLVNNTQKTLDILTGNPMGGVPRNDIVVFDSNPASVGIRAIIGTPNASPTDPTVPTTAIPLARIRNLASAITIPTAQIDDLRTFTNLAPTPAPAWQAFTPVWTGGSALSIGNGTLIGRFVDDGKLRRIHVELTRGSTTNVGAGPYTFTLPAGSYASSGQSGSGWYRDASPFTEMPLTVVGIGSGAVALVTPAGARLTYNTIAWAAGDSIVFDLFAELA